MAYQFEGAVRRKPDVRKTPGEMLVVFHSAGGLTLSRPDPTEKAPMRPSRRCRLGLSGLTFLD